MSIIKAPISVFPEEGAWPKRGETEVWSHIDLIHEGEVFRFRVSKNINEERLKKFLRGFCKVPSETRLPPIQLVEKGVYRVE